MWLLNTALLAELAYLSDGLPEQSEIFKLTTNEFVRVKFKVSGIETSSSPTSGLSLRFSHHYGLNPNASVLLYLQSNLKNHEQTCNKTNV